MAFVDNATVQQTANVALTTTEANLFPVSAANGVAVAGSGPGRSSAPCLAIVSVSNVTGIAAAAAVTVNIRAGTSIAGTVIGSGVDTNPGAGASAAGPVTIVALVPAGTESVFVGAVMSSGTGTAIAAATTPITLALIYLD